jgi:hypothetical protein
MRGRSHAALTAHGFTKSFRKTHLVALSLIQVKAYTVLAVLSCSLLPSASYLYHAFNAEDQPLMNTYLQHCRTTHRYLFPNNLRAARRYVRRKHNAEGDAQKSTKVKEKGVQHCICFPYSRYPISTHNILATLAFLLPVCVIVVIVRKHLHFQYYERRPLTRLNVKPNLWSSIPKRVLLLPQVQAC